MAEIKLKENVCEFCGQVFLSGQQCNCPGAKQHRELQTAFDDAVAEVKSLVPNWNEGTINSINASAYEIIFGVLKSATFEDDEGIKIKLASASKGYIKIDKTKTSKSSVTI